MKKSLKQVEGIDVGKKELIVSIGLVLDDLAPEVFGHHKFPNAV